MAKRCSDSRRRVLGSFGGEPVEILHARPRRSTAAVPGDAYLRLSDRAVNLDDGHLNARLARLVPPGHARAPLDAWRPFLVLLRALGWGRAGTVYERRREGRAIR